VHNRVLNMPVKAYAIAQKGKASGSSAANAAVPNPCELEAVAMPLAIGSVNPNVFISVWAKFAPTSPVSTTTAAVRDRLLPSRSLAMGRARATVTQRGTMEHVRKGGNPRRRPAAAVEYKEKMDVMPTAVTISVACLCTTCTILPALA
jgi:hypothetical protein